MFCKFLAIKTLDLEPDPDPYPYPYPVRIKSMRIHNPGALSLCHVAFAERFLSEFSSNYNFPAIISFLTEFFCYTLMVSGRILACHARGPKSILGDNIFLCCTKQ
jgi:hypothetical protein